MSALLSAFGIDWRLLIINMVNFGLLLLALWYFLYAPLMRMLDERRQKVAKGMHDAEESERILKDVAGKRSDMLSEAGKEADDLVAQSRAAAAKKERDIIAASEARAEGVLRDAQVQAQELKATAIAESKQEVAKLVVLGMEKVFKQ